MAHQRSEYENYLLVSQYTKMLGGTYPKYLKTKALMSSLNSMAGKQSNTYIYNGESYVSSLTNSVMQTTGVTSNELNSMVNDVTNKINLGDSGDG